jgi:hypothetical protein
VPLEDALSSIRLAAGSLLGLLFAVPAFAAPRAVLVEPLHVDAGEVEPGQVQKFDWTLRNDGDAPLLIESLTPTCYCTHGKADAMQVAPQATTKIHVTIDPSDFVGKINKGVEIATNDPTKAKQMVDVDLVVRPGIAVVPPELDFSAAFRRPAAPKSRSISRPPRNVPSRSPRSAPTPRMSSSRRSRCRSKSAPASGSSSR